MSDPSVELDDEDLHAELQRRRAHLLTTKRHLADQHAQLRILLGSSPAGASQWLADHRRLSCQSSRSLDPEPSAAVSEVAQEAAARGDGAPVAGGSGADSVLALEERLLAAMAENEALQVDVRSCHREMKRLTAEKDSLELRLQQLTTELSGMRAADQETQHRATMLAEVQVTVRWLEERLQSAKEWELLAAKNRRDAERLERENGSYLELLLDQEEEVARVRQQNSLFIQEVEAYKSKEAEIEALLNQLQKSKQQYEEKNRLLGLQMHRQAEESRRLVELVGSRGDREQQAAACEELKAQLRDMSQEVAQLKQEASLRQAEFQAQLVGEQQARSEALALRDEAVHQADAYKQQTLRLQDQLTKLLTLPTKRATNRPAPVETPRPSVLTPHNTNTERRSARGKALPEEPIAATLGGGSARALPTRSKGGPPCSPLAGAARRSKSNPLVRPTSQSDPTSTIISSLRELRAQIFLQEELVSSHQGMEDPSAPGHAPLRPRAPITPSSQACHPHRSASSKVHAPADPSTAGSCRSFPSPVRNAHLIVWRAPTAADRPSRSLEPVLATPKKRFTSLH